MKYKQHYVASLTLTIVVTILAVVCQVNEWSGADNIILLGSIISLGFIITGLNFILTSGLFSTTSKVFWVIGFLLLSTFTGILFYLQYVRHDKNK